MMRITIVCAGKIKETYLSEGIAQFRKRIRPYAQLEFRETPEERRPEAPSPAEREQSLRREGERLLSLVPENAYLYVLDLHGEDISSEELAEEMAGLALRGKSHIAFLIGGPFGLSDEVRRSADRRLRFSRLTFTHQMIRLLLVEQIYRAFKINRGEKYHW